MITQKLIKNIKKSLEKIEDGTLYSASEVFKLDVVFSINGERSKQRVCRVLRTLPRVNMGIESHPRWFILGKNLRKYVETQYINNFNN